MYKFFTLIKTVFVKYPSIISCGIISIPPITIIILIECFLKKESQLLRGV